MCVTIVEKLMKWSRHFSLHQLSVIHIYMYKINFICSLDYSDSRNFNIYHIVMKNFT